MKYNFTNPENVFVGHDDILEEIRNGLRNGVSFAIIGGDCTGKTAILLKIKKELSTNPSVKPCYLDIRTLDKKMTLNDLYKKIYDITVKGLKQTAPPYTNKNEDKFDNFLHNIEKAKSAIKSEYGENWQIVILINRLDKLSLRLPDETFYEKLNFFLRASEYRDRFRLVAAGTKTLSSLIYAGSSLNILTKKYLGIVTEEAARALIGFGFTHGFLPEVEKYFFDLTGRHPYIMQGILQNVKKDNNVDIHDINNAKETFSPQCDNFRTWLTEFDKYVCTVYYCLSEAEGGMLTYENIKRGVHPDVTPHVDDSLTTLKYHGVIDRSVHSRPKIAGEIFKEWFKDHCPKGNIILTERSALINALSNIIKAVNDSALNDTDKTTAISTLNQAVKKLQATGSDDTIDKKGLSDSIKGILQTSGTILKTSKDYISGAETIGKFIGDGVNLLAGLL
ncbi:MAG: hypothetical protein H7844_10680 [Nitrospirae bacterium YQR-1]